jgi:hypothetical protein
LDEVHDLIPAAQNGGNNLLDSEQVQIQMS